jgi:Domain of unknown function DUF29
MKAAQLYDRDFAEWARQNAELLRSGHTSEADLEHIAEEIEDMGKRERRSLHNRLVRLIEHLLKWEFQPERRGSSWQRTIIVQRCAAKRQLDENPSFGPALPQIVFQAYQDAVAILGAVIADSRIEFPEACSYSIDQLLDEQFLGKSH